MTSSILTWPDVCQQLRLNTLPLIEGQGTAVFELQSVEQLSDIDRHGLKLAVRFGLKPRLACQVQLPDWIQARLEIECTTHQDSTFISNQPGSVVQWLNQQVKAETLAAIWRDYQTSRDHPFTPPIGSTLKESWPHLRLGLVAGVDLFQASEYYAAHEAWESLWIRLPEGAEKLCIQALIQLCGAHIHRLKGRTHSQETMWTKARRNLELAAPDINWLAIDQLICDSERVLSSTLNAPIAWPVIPLVNRHADVPRKHW